MASKLASQALIRSFAVDRGSPVPLYFQVAQHLERAIEAGTLPPGTLFDNEIHLSEQLGVSRPTTRRAMEHLVGKGLIVRRRGIGTRVVQPKVRRPLELTSLFDDLAGTGQQPTTQVLELDTRPCDAEVAARLGLTEGDPVLHLVRLRCARELPIAKLTNHLPTSYLPPGIGSLTADDLREHGLYELMRRRGVHLHSATQTVGARTATVAEAALLGEPRGAAVLTMQRETLDDNGVTVEYATHLYAASRYTFEINLVRG